MKIQELAIIFIIIILPISLLLSEYTQFQIQTIALQTEYDARLTAATYDAIRAFQLNAINNTTSDMANSKLRDLEASIATFRNSIMTGFELNGYTEDDLNNYIPALVYTLYDGFYIYSPYENTHDELGNRISDLDEADSIYGLKPYINYSCRYVYPPNNPNPLIDVVITYTLDNYITVQGMIDGKYVNESGYLINGISYDKTTDKVTYNGVEIKNETLKEYLVGYGVVNYIKINGTKKYLLEGYGENDKDCIASILNGTLLIEYDEDDLKFYEIKNKILNNDSAKNYYKKAFEFTEWFNSTKLIELKYCHAYDEVIADDGTTSITNVWNENETPIFKENTGKNIENELSNFNQHRLAVIRHKIETNLAIAISNYNSYSKDTTNVFQMPELKEDEWDSITHNISVISFLQGLHIGGKKYNGYTLVTNSESEEVVLEDSIYILGKDAAYHKIGDKGLEDGTIEVEAEKYGSAGKLNLDFEKKSITKNDKNVLYYPLVGYKASYDSIVMQNNVTMYDDIYDYINEEKIPNTLKEAFYTALGRERESKYNSNNVIENNGPYLPNGYKIVSGTDLDTGLAIEDEEGNQYVWVEVPRSLYNNISYNTKVTTEDMKPESETDYDKIEYCLKEYTSNYRKNNCEDEYCDFIGITEEEYYKLKNNMLKSTYKNGGFYIGRYETGINYDQGPRIATGETTQKPVIKKNAYPYNRVTCAQAQMLAESFATEGYSTSLLFGVQWDLMLKYLESKGVPQNELKTNSKSWGNYRESLYKITNTGAKYSLEEGKVWSSVTTYNKTNVKSVMLTTGASESFRKQNIYDLAGNLYEWTLERQIIQKKYIERGNYYGGSSVDYNVAVRGIIDNAEARIFRGFRVTLFKN